MAGCKWHCVCVSGGTGGTACVNLLSLGLPRGVFSTKQRRCRLLQRTPVGATVFGAVTPVKSAHFSAPVRCRPPSHPPEPLRTFPLALACLRAREAWLASTLSQWVASDGPTPLLPAQYDYFFLLLCWCRKQNRVMVMPRATTGHHHRLGLVVLGQYLASITWHYEPG